MSENEEITHNTIPQAVTKLIVEVSEIKKLLIARSNDPPSSPEGLLTTLEVSKLVGLSKSTLVHLKKSGLPYYKVKDSVRFSKQDVIDFISKYKQINSK